MFGFRFSAAENGREIRGLTMKSLLLTEKTDAPLLEHGNGQHAKCTGFIAKSMACGPLNYGTLKPLYSTRASLIMLRP